MKFLLHEIPPFLKEKVNVIRQVLITALFALFFMNTYSPFNAQSWFDVGRVEFFFYSSLYILAGMLLIVVSRIIFIMISEQVKFNYLKYLLWNIAEVLLLAMVYTLLDHFFIRSEVSLASLYMRMLGVTILILAIPYSVTWLWFSWKDQKKRLQTLSSVASDSYREKKMISFFDETDKLRFSVKSSELLYIESTDNYVTVVTKEKGKLKKTLIRDTMKRLEKELEGTLIARCHRSYMVNFENVRAIRLIHANLFIDMDTEDNIRIPVSGTYAEKVHETLNRVQKN